MTSSLPKEQIEHIVGVFESLSKEPFTLDISDPIPHPELHDSVIYTVMIDSDIHVEMRFQPLPSTNQLCLTSITGGRFTCLDMIADHNLFPEVRLEIYHDSEHSLAWDRTQPIEEIITEARMGHLLLILQRMHEQVTDIFADESLM